MRIPFRRDEHPHADLLEPLVAEFEDLFQQGSERVAQMQTWMGELEAHRVVRQPWELWDYGSRTRKGAETYRHDIRLPYASAQTLKHTYRIAGRLPDFRIPRRDEEALERYRQEALEALLLHSWRISDGPSQFADAGFYCSATGAAAFELRWLMREQCVRIRAIDPSTVYPVLGADDAHDYERVYRSWLEPLSSVRYTYGTRSVLGGPIPVDDIAESETVRGVKMVRLVEMADGKQRVRWASARGGVDGILLGHETHTHGIVPFQIVPNLGPFRRVFGYSDYEFVRQVNRYLSLLFSRQADVVAAVANGAYLSKGTGQPVETVLNVVRNGGILGSKLEGEVVPIPAPEFPSWIDKHSDTAYQSLMDLGFTPMADWGTGPGSTSGSERVMQLQPARQLQALKQVNLGAGLKRLNGKVLALYETLFTAERQRFQGSLESNGRRRGYAVNLGQGTALDVESGAPVPASPRDLIAGDYATEVIFRPELDLTDPNYVLSELNKFQQAVQSAQTTLQNLGVEDPQAELRLVKKEADELPWLRQGALQLLQMQMEQEAAAGAGSPAAGAPPGPPPGAGSMDGGLGMMAQQGSGSGALNFDAFSAALNGSDSTGGQSDGGLGGAPMGGA